jgi:diguanylate cyclase (GGDEF)-like protein
MLVGNEKNELGLWINTANQLLSSIERNSHLRREAENSLLRMAQYDFLTGLPNRQQLQQQLDQILNDAGRLQRRVAVLCVGLDDFKGINEQFSYQTGDQLLLSLSDRLRSHSGRLGALARLGGDQFVLVQADIEQPYEAAELAQSILDDLERPFNLDQQEVRLRATIGITLFPEDGDSTEKLLQKAEQTMTLAKNRSRNRYQFYIASVDSEMRRRRELEKDLREALSLNQLFMVYQPQVDYRDHRIVGVEALLRWQHPQHGLVPPDLFIPLAEQNGTIIAIGEWVLDQACKQLREWHDQGFSELRMAINLSTVQLHHAELPRVVNNLMQVYRLPPRSLELEVTETGLMEDITTAAQHLLSLRRSGALIAIDDFGTGYSSLSYLKSLPLDKIKIDKSFVQDLLDDEDEATIVRAIIQLGKSLGMQVIAEGVETVEQEAYIIAQGCNEGQGYFYSKPLPARELLLFLKQARRINQAAINPVTL